MVVAELTKLVGVTEKLEYSGTSVTKETTPELLLSIYALPSSVVTWN